MTQQELMQRSEKKSAKGEATLALHRECVRVFAFYNMRYFGGKLPTPLFAFFPQPPNGNRLGHYCPRRWKTGAGKDGVLRDEVVLYADLCLERGWLQVVRTLAHEFVHLWQEHCGKPSKAAAFHNREWHAKCAELGLVTTGPKGYTEAGPGFDADAKRLSKGAIPVPWRPNGARQRAKGKMLLWMCSCGTKIRSGRHDLDIHCNECDTDFTLQE